jgi:GNAT superfamily N-acetyltransferase
MDPADLDAIVRLDAILTGESKRMYWNEMFDLFLRDTLCIALVYEGGSGIDGFLLGEVRAFEFGSSECGWITVLGVRPEQSRQGLASALLARARKRFLDLGVTSLRTMVNRTDVSYLSFFRNSGFVGGPYVQLELDLEERTA